MHISNVYWEGAVDITGTSNGAPVNGSGEFEIIEIELPPHLVGHAVSELTAARPV